MEETLVGLLLLDMSFMSRFNFGTPLTLKEGADNTLKRILSDFERFWKALVLFFWVRTWSFRCRLLDFAMDNIATSVAVVALILRCLRFRLLSVSESESESESKSESKSESESNEESEDGGSGSESEKDDVVDREESDSDSDDEFASDDEEGVGVGFLLRSFLFFVFLVFLVLVLGVGGFWLSWGVPPSERLSAETNRVDAIAITLSTPLDSSGVVNAVSDTRPWMVAHRNWSNGKKSPRFFLLRLAKLKISTMAVCGWIRRVLKMLVNSRG